MRMSTILDEKGCPACGSRQPNENTECDSCGNRLN